ncbi:BP74-related protein [Streptosporangium amethystogenes]|uniref:BP74-related protein n=1 Tax=Streptosporangium amethystogenes TaxID=2002 RepID=UPI003CD07BCD
MPRHCGWSYHFDPATLGFFDVAIEVCDATMTYVEDHLDEAGGAFLPGNLWCPWSSKPVREVPAP